MRTLREIERDLRFARANHDTVKTPATAAYVRQLERERAKVVVQKNDGLRKLAKRLVPILLVAVALAGCQGTRINGEPSAICKAVGKSKKECER